MQGATATQANVDCDDLNPSMSVPGVPGGGEVSKGLNVDIGSEDSLYQRMWDNDDDT
ncbi:MAG: hypothetical protein GY759_07245 [Chloroflexi bacterium]|nr:hypothetical protein [Chloroflexota bacterium]